MRETLAARGTRQEGKGRRKRRSESGRNQQRAGEDDRTLPADAVRERTQIHAPQASASTTTEIVRPACAGLTSKDRPSSGRIAWVESVTANMPAAPSRTCHPSRFRRRFCSSGSSHRQAPRGEVSLSVTRIRVLDRDDADDLVAVNHGEVTETAVDHERGGMVGRVRRSTVSGCSSCSPRQWRSGRDRRRQPEGGIASVGSARDGRRRERPRRRLRVPPFGVRPRGGQARARSRTRFWSSRRPGRSCADATGLPFRADAASLRPALALRRVASRDPVGAGERHARHRRGLDRQPRRDPLARGCEHAICHTRGRGSAPRA